jgi:hypothetical protein
MPAWLQLAAILPPRFLMATMIVAGVSIVPAPGLAPRGAVVVERHATRTLHENTRWRADRLHILEGVVRVAPGATLTIDAGARIEAASGAAVVVDRDGRLIAVGTLYEPIIFRCVDDASAMRGCWEGVIIAGNAPLNGGSTISPPARGVGGSGCAQRADEPLTTAYGGCDPEDNSGTLRFVRVEHAARGLLLLGVGRGTQVETVQVFGSGAAGVVLRGGTVDLRELLVTGGGDVGIWWSAGWTGRLQFAVVQSSAASLVGLLGQNDAASPDAQPRSAPVISNVSLLQLPTAASSVGIRLADGTTADLSNVIVAGYSAALDVDGASTCNRIGADLRIRHSVVAGVGAMGDPDVDATCSLGDGVEDVLLDDASIGRITDAGALLSLLKSGFGERVPDFRAEAPILTSLAVAPPVDGFFRPAAFVGAVESISGRPSSIPWFSGWTRDGLAPGAPLRGALTGIVSSSVRGPLNGARVESGGASTLTAPDGTFGFEGLLAGTAAIQVTTVPAGCAAPAPVTAQVPAGSGGTVDVSVMCSEPTIVTTGVVLTYICENRFRVRNPNDAVLPVTWDVHGTGAGGALSLPARPIGGTVSETFFDVGITGTVRLLYQGIQIQVKANGGAACLP